MVSYPYVGRDVWATVLGILNTSVLDAVLSYLLRRGTWSLEPGNGMWWRASIVVNGGWCCRSSSGGTEIGNAGRFSGEHMVILGPRMF